MMTRKAEWLASIKPILDRDEAKRDAKELAKELEDILEIKIGAGPEGLDELGKVFNEQLKAMGKQQIVFSDKTLRGMVSQLANAITGGISKGIVDGIKDGVAASSADVLKQIEALTKRRTELHEQSAKLDKTYRKYERLSGVSSKDYDRFKPLELSSDVDIDEQAQQIMGAFIDAEDALNDATRGTKEYNNALVKALEAAENLYRMSHTLRANKNLVKDKTLLSDFDFMNLSDITADVFDKADVDFNKYLRDFDKYYNNKISTIKSELNQIETTMESLQQQRVELINEENVNKSLKSAKEIEEAYNRILRKEKNADKIKEKIRSATEYTPGEESLQVLSNRYKTSVSSNQDWEIQYQWMVKFVKEYEAYLHQIDVEEDKTKKKNMRARANKYAELYGDVKPLVGGAENALRSLIDMTGGVKAEQDTDAVENAQKLVEAAEAKAQYDRESAKATANIRSEVEATVRAEAESLEIAKQKRAEEEATLAAAKERNSLPQTTDDTNRVSGGILDNPMFANMFKRATVDAKEKSVASEASADAAKEELEATQQTTGELEKQQKLLLYRRVEGEFDPNRISSRSADALYDKYNKPTIQQALQSGFGSHGDGLYGSVLSGAKDLERHAKDGDVSYFAFDASDYNLYVNKTLEEAELLGEFLLSLQKFVGDGTILDSSQLPEIEDLNEQELYKAAQLVIKNFDMSQEQFHLWLENAKKEAEEIARLFEQGQVPDNRHNFGTRFMKTLGYQGVLNDTEDDEYNGNYQGSVIYDPDVDKIKESLVVFKSVDEYLEHVGATARDADQAVDSLNESLGQNKELKSGGGAGSWDASLEELETERSRAESIQAENDALQNQLQASEVESHTKDNVIQSLRQQLAESKANAGDASSEDLELAHRELEQLRVENSQLQGLNDELERDNQYYMDALYDEVGRANQAEARVIELEQQVAGSFTGDEKHGSVNTEELKTLLSAIVYNVKITHDDNDKQANKIALDDSTLESTLTKVFANILNPEISQGGEGQNQEPWALESTLQNVKDVLDQIKNNTTPDKQPDDKNLIRDPQGNIVTAYRGTHDSYVGLSSNRYNGASFFTDSLDLARMQYAGKNGKVEAANLSMTNPLELDAQGGSWAAIEYIGDNADEASQKLHQLQSKIEQLKILINSASDAKPGSMAAEIASLRRVEIEGLEKEKRKIFNDLSNPYGRYTTDQIAERLPEWGYDGAIIKNLVDGGTVPSTVMISLDPSQVHYIETLSGLMDDSNANELNVQQKQVDGDVVKNNNNESFALESTLQTVKGILDNIQTNTAKIGVAEPSNVDTIAGTAFDGRLMEIKSVLESIDKKIAKGGTITKKDDDEPKNNEQKDKDDKPSKRVNEIKSLATAYANWGKLSAKAANDGNLETKAMLQNLEDEIERKRQSLKLTQEEKDSLKEKYDIAFNAEKRLLDAAKAQEKINEQNKQKDQDWKKTVKDAQRETGINAADSVYRATNNTVIRAIGTEGIYADIEAKAKELAEQNKVLNDIRNSIHTKGTEASEKDRDALSKQITKVKELKTEFDGYLKIHEKYSGEGSTQFDNVDTSNFGAVGTDQYWNSITAAIKNASSGRVAIKGMNTDTGELTGTTKIAANTFAEWSATVDPITGKLSMVRTGIKKTETLIESITRKTKEVFTYFSGSSIIFKAFNELKKGIQYVREIDLALTELKRVTNETEESYDKFLTTASKTADKLGSTMSEVIKATADFARLNIRARYMATYK